MSSAAHIAKNSAMQPAESPQLFASALTSELRMPSSPCQVAKTGPANFSKNFT
ncbi:hypothetical protein COCMIDRAFT_82320 [Bipolaris oryzae ATCC 44560]|uniref:Uncharacterized protein n=1 Tax=Bipolaris oryzae ATCC 44560 TaxID=930090 RepID=W6ZES5_COCMI|nr:uncharacterized protein COCMIDRAFT_82320 [Bipolaris oryzae ATCC 44560]EUC50327.1 hypothetical protein COCMIDRAFT_82320 [Bipolaris oryzae ATCC 44560]